MFPAHRYIALVEQAGKAHALVSDLMGEFNKLVEMDQQSAKENT